MNLESGLKVVVGSVVAFGVHVLGCSIVEFDFLFAPDRLVQFVLYHTSWWLLMRCKNVVLLLLLYFELEVLGLVEQVLVGIGNNLVLLILIQKVNFLHLIQIPLEILINSNLLFRILMAVLLYRWNWECSHISIFSEQWFLIDLIQQIQFR